MELRDICTYNKTKGDTSQYAIEDYVSTENMLPNKAGITIASNLPEGKATIYQVGDILISNIRPYFKKIWKADKEGCCSGDVLCIRSNENTNNEYLYYLLSQDVFFDYVMKGAKGTKMPRGDKEQIMQYPVNLPDLPTQRRIASILSSLDAKIETNNKINANLEAQAQALFKSWFVDFEPFKDGNFIDSELGKIPEGWRVGRLLDVFDLKPGGTPSTTNDKYWKNGTIPFFGPKDVVGMYCFNTEKHITEDGLNNCASQLYPKDTVFLTARGTVGKVTMAALPMAMNQSNYALVGKDGITQIFVYFFVLNEVKKLLKLANGAVFSAITTKDFKGRVVIPDTKSISEFTVLIKPIFDNIHKNSTENLTLSTLRDTLLPKLMSGEIEV